MIDIINFNETTNDFVVANTLTEKAKNVLEVQIGSLEYASSFGIDLAFFLSEDFIFMNDSFKAYLLQRLSESSIDVSSVLDLVDGFTKSYIFNLQDRPSGGLIRG